MSLDYLIFSLKKPLTLIYVFAITYLQYACCYWQCKAMWCLLFGR